MSELDSAGGLAKTRIRASVACSYCRSKRSKCDGVPGRQSCNQCRQRGIECEMPNGKRNRGHYKPQVEALMKQIQNLERALAQAQAINSKATGPNPACQATTCASDAVTYGSQTVQAPSVPSEPVLDLRLDVSEALLEDIAGRFSTNCNASGHVALETVAQSHLSEIYTPSGATAWASQESARVPHTMWKTTSGPVTTNEELTLGASSTKSFSHLNLTSSATDYLLGLFFHRYQIMMKFVSQRAFMAQKDLKEGPSPRSSLMLAMLSAGLRYSSRQEVTGAYLGPDGENLLATAAKKALESELVSTNVSTVQTLLILGEVETSSGNQMTGYMYASMAAKLLFELSLDLGSCTTESPNHEEIQVRHWIAWAASVQDQYWAILLKRPLTIKSQTLQTSRLAWRFSRSKIDAEADEIPSFESQVNESLLDLMELAREATDALYGSSLSSRPSHNAVLGIIDRFDARLNQWFGGLPEKMRRGPVGGQDSYHFLFVLHLHLNTTRIVLHQQRGFPVSDHQPGPTAPSTSTSKLTISQPQSQSRAILATSATRIAKLFESFRRREDIRTLQCTGVQWATLAAKTLTRYINTLPVDEAVEAVAHLQSLNRTLKEMSKTFKSAVSSHKSTTRDLQLFMRQMEGDDDNPPLAHETEISPVRTWDVTNHQVSGENMVRRGDGFNDCDRFELLRPDFEANVTLSAPTSTHTASDSVTAATQHSRIVPDDFNCYVPGVANAQVESWSDSLDWDDILII